MSNTTPARCPQGARRRTADRERQPSLMSSASIDSMQLIFNSSASFSSVTRSGDSAVPASTQPEYQSPSEDGLISTSDVSQGASLSRSSHRRRNYRPTRSNTSGSVVSSSAYVNTQDRSRLTSHSRGYTSDSIGRIDSGPLVDISYEQRPENGSMSTNSRSASFFTEDNTTRGIVHTSPPPSVASFRRGSEPDGRTNRGGTVFSTTHTAEPSSIYGTGSVGDSVRYANVPTPPPLPPTSKVISPPLVPHTTPPARKSSLPQIPSSASKASLSALPGASPSMPPPFTHRSMDPVESSRNPQGGMYTGGRTIPPPVPPIPPMPSIPPQPEAPIPGTNQTRGSPAPAKRWDTVRRAVYNLSPSSSPAPTTISITPDSTSQASSPHLASTATLRITPATSVSTASNHNAAAGFSIPRTGSALSHLSDTNLAVQSSTSGTNLLSSPAVSTLSISSGNLTHGSSTTTIHASRTRAVTNFLNFVDQARSGMAHARSGVLEWVAASCLVEVYPTLKRLKGCCCNNRRT
ncbi:hypothetical protein FRB91_002517 [Serendipita sp. 411]|nr:hypothetical protein FRC19_011005 [Serendipita sp. 401]KAG8855217.1 hypothetical protein FRB91_002517 [Serendipita sp. 411]KAG9053958.1 hypothetical protein FS842_006621 [Serendipita sp. 407]